MEPTATNPRTGEKVVFRGGQWVPLTSAQQGGGAQFPGIVQGRPRPAPEPDPYKPPAGYRGTPENLEPIPGGPADPTAPQNQPRGGVKSATELDLEAKEASAQRRANTIESILGEVKRLYNQDIKGQPITRAFGATEKIDSLPRNERFRAAANNILPLIRPLVAQTAREGDSDKEMEVFLSYIPHNDDSDITIEQKFKQLELLIGGMVEGRAPSETLQDGSDGAVATNQSGDTRQGGTGYGTSDPTPPPLSSGGPGYQFADGTKTVNDPRMEQISAEYRQRLADGQSASEIIPWLRQQGVGPETLRQAVQQIRYRRENPQVPIDRYSITASREEPLTGFEQVTNALGSGPVGSYALGAGNFLSGNTLDNLSGDPERVRLALEVSRATNPNAFALGEVSGGIMAGLAGEAGLARAGLASGIGRSVLADSAMGGANAAGMADNGGRIQNALLGAVIAGAGSAGGTAAIRGASRAIAPTGGSARTLYDQGIRPTLGQRVAEGGGGRGFKGTVGGMINAAEEHMQSVPVVGSAIRGARQEARDQFQIGAFNQALAEVGEQLPKGMRPGTAPHKFSRKVFDRVYDDARSGMRLVGDEELANDMSGLAERAALLAEPSAKRFERIMRNVVIRRVGSGREMDGEAFKKVQSELGKQIRSIRNNQSGDGELAEVLEELQFALDAGARRHSDPAAVELLDAADAGYAKLVRIEEAAARRGGGAGEFTPAQFDSAVQRTSGGIRSKAYLRGDALMQDYAQAGMGLVDRVPNSGTPERQMAGLVATGGLGFLDPTFLTALGTVGAAYAPGVRRVTAGAMAPSGPRAKAIADRLRKRARLIGATTAASGAVALQGTAQNQ